MSALLLLSTALGLGRGGQDGSGDQRRPLLHLDFLLGRVVKQAGPGGAVELDAGHFEVVVEADDGRGHEAERQKVREGEPVPVLGEDGHADNARHVEVARLRLKTDSAVPAARVEDTKRKRGTKLGHGVLVAVTHHLPQRLPDRGDLGVHDLILLHHDHGQRDERTLADKVGRVLHHRLKQVDSLVQSGAGARDTQRHGGAIPHVGVVRLGEQLNHARNAAGLPKEDKTEAHDGDTADIVVNVADGGVQELPDGLVASGSAVRQRNGENTAISQRRVGVVQKALDDAVGTFLAPVHDERHAEGTAADNLLMARFVRVREQGLNRLGVAGSQHDQAHGQADTLTVQRRVCK